MDLCCFLLFQFFALFLVKNLFNVNIIFLFCFVKKNGVLQEYWQEAQSAHEEVCADGRALANHLSSPVPTGSHTSLTAAVDYSQGRKHCTDLVHEVSCSFLYVF